MGLNEDQFWALTPRLFFALLDRIQEREKRWDHRFGMVCSTMSNIHRDEKKRKNAFEPADFFYSLATDEQRQNKGKGASSWKSQLNAVKGMHQRLKGRGAASAA